MEMAFSTSWTKAVRWFLASNKGTLCMTIIPDTDMVQWYNVYIHFEQNHKNNLVRIVGIPGKLKH